MYRRDTISAIATGPAAGGIAIVRVSGPEAGAIAAHVFRGFPIDAAESHRLYPGRIVDAEGGVIDHGLAVVMRAPRSYTGEDVLELHCHGGVLVARAVLFATLAAGARAAERGEFTLRAFLNGKLDLAQAESVADLIAARSPAAMRAAASQLEGSLSRAVEELRDELIGIAARLEVALDFSEEDVGELDREALAHGAEAARSRAQRLASSYERGRVLREGLRVAIVGKPNVGKSSLLNRLLGSERAIVTPVPGTTRDVIEEGLVLSGVPIVLVDTAGIRAASGGIEKIGIERSQREIEAADLLLVVLDASRPFEEADASVLAATRQNKRIIVINKIDLRRSLDIAGAGDGSTSIHVSAKTGIGMEALEVSIAADFGIDPALAPEVTVMRERHRSALDCAASSLASAIDSLESGAAPDLVSVDIMRALSHLGEVGGESSSEDVLDRIFRDFCIGK